MKGQHKRKVLRYFTGVVLLLILTVPYGFTHGTKYELLTDGIIGVKAMYDTGEVMADARVLIFAPGEAEASIITRTDSRGIVCFKPDKSGTWVLQVLEDTGHGMRINLKVDEALTLAEGVNKSAGFTWLQKAVLALCVVWGFTGTALFMYSRRKR
ncbi:MAG: hypothetical protein DRP87_06520 [Spirochaetes bacterium]|nr:MAG: hypothetical protein DRP87_06520 [Spirochaetota bacterium]